MDDHFDPTDTDIPAPVVDRATLEHLLNVGGAELRPALAAQICADFARLAAAIQGPDGTHVARAAHELKGLAATVGAANLARMADTLNVAAPGLSAGKRRMQVQPVAAGIAAVLAIMRRAEPGAVPS